MKKYPFSWYPIGTSSMIKLGQVKSICLFDQEWILFRGFSGKLGLVQSHCEHMGTHLKKGKVIADEIQCPFHLFRYNTDGICKVSCKTEQYTLGKKKFTVKEKYNVIFIFPGEKEKFDFSEIIDIKNEALSYVFTKKLNTPFESLIFNGFDPHHLSKIHNREIDGDLKFTSKNKFHLRAQFSLKNLNKNFYDKFVNLLGSKNQFFYLECWGGNTAVISNHRLNFNVVISSVPIKENLSQIFIFSLIEKKNGFFRNLRATLLIHLVNFLAVRFLDPDVRIVENMKPEIKTLIPEFDAPVKTFWNYWDQLEKYE